MARHIRTLIDSLKRRRSDQRTKDATRIKRQQDEKRHRRGGGDHGGVPPDHRVAETEVGSAEGSAEGSERRERYGFRLPGVARRLAA
jgi:hypothetical protein